MRYVIRAVKYFLYIVVLVTVILAVLAASGFVSSDINVMFRNGWKSVWLILAVFAFVSAFYPRFGYGRRQVHITGEYSQIRQGVINYMTERGYRLEKELGEDMTFRSRSAARRIARVWEDRITMERCLGGFVLEGPGKDVVRLAGGLEYRFRGSDSAE
jgi:hypothetical protein